jgi:hypothetical protein
MLKSYQVGTSERDSHTLNLIFTDERKLVKLIIAMVVISFSYWRIVRVARHV